MQESYRGGAVIGIGLGSSESGNLPRKWKELHRKFERVDHGVHLAEDSEMPRRVTDERLMLTVCPISNVTLRCVNSIPGVPTRKFLDAGVRFSVSSDGPAYVGGYILDNCCVVQGALILVSWSGGLSATAEIEGGWCIRARKQEMLGALEDVVGKWD